LKARRACACFIRDTGHIGHEVIHAGSIPAAGCAGDGGVAVRIRVGGAEHAGPRATDVLEGPDPAGLALAAVGPGVSKRTDAKGSTAGGDAALTARRAGAGAVGVLEFSRLASHAPPAVGSRIPESAETRKVGR
jgi:hypothetical protein